MNNEAAYLESLKSLLPPGAAFPQQSGTALESVLSVFASEFSKIEARSFDVINESDPRTTIELLEEWETQAGLPDECIGSGGTLQERRDLLVQRITSRGGQSVEFFTQVAIKMGYSVNITEYKPFISGKSRCGTALSGTITNDEKIRQHWTVNIPNARITDFKTGASRCGESLGKISRAEDLECVLNRIKPAHTTLHFNYQGVA